MAQVLDKGGQQSLRVSWACKFECGVLAARPGGGSACPGSMLIAFSKFCPAGSVPDSWLLHTPPTPREMPETTRSLPGREMYCPRTEKSSFFDTIDGIGERAILLRMLQVQTQEQQARGGSAEPQSRPLFGERFNHETQANLHSSSQGLQAPHGLAAPGQLECSTAVDARLDPHCRAPSSTLPADKRLHLQQAQVPQGARTPSADRDKFERLAGLATAAEAATLLEVSPTGPTPRKRPCDDADEDGALEAGTPEAAAGGLGSPGDPKPKKAKKPRRNEAAQLIEATLLSAQKLNRVDSGASTPLDLSLERRPKATAPKPPPAASPAKSRSSGKSRGARPRPFMSLPSEGPHGDHSVSGDQADARSREPPSSSGPGPQSSDAGTGLSSGLSMADRIKSRGQRAKASLTVTPNGPLVKHTGASGAKPPKPAAQQLQAAGLKPAYQASGRFVPAPPKYASLNVLQKSGAGVVVAKRGRGRPRKSIPLAQPPGKGSKNSSMGQPVKANRKARAVFSPGSLLKNAGVTARATSRAISKAPRKARSAQTPRTPRFSGNQCTRARPLLKVAQKLKPAGAGPSAVAQPRPSPLSEVCGLLLLEERVGSSCRQ